MTQQTILDRPPGRTVRYIVRGGQGRSVLVAGQVIRILAGVGDTASGYGAVVLESTVDKRPIPMHFHEKEHDTWLCTRGRLQVWSNDRCRVLTEGDFAYVKPGDTHSYQCVSPRTQFFGIVAPGGWEGFFDDAGEPWAEAALPQPSHPYDFSRMGPAMGKHGVMRVEKDYCAPGNGDATDRELPKGPATYALQSGYGTRHLLNGHLATTLLDMAISEGALEIRTIEAGRGARMPSLQHQGTHLTLYVLNGTLLLTLDDEAHELHDGDFANIPAGTNYSTEVISGNARWVYSAANGNGLSYWSAGDTTEGFAFETSAASVGLDQVAGVDVDLVQ
ncbi:quercetin 2,3-dioxygenase family protein [Corticibacterium sp. UT-5YL-CI-8]|nr:quercetin 2,3-dioxygenase family protein [Tianweitania sp. UT-5YL-CI-8]